VFPRLRVDRRACPEYVPKYVPHRAYDRRHARRAEWARLPGRSASAVRSGTRSTACRTVGRCNATSGRRGPSAAARAAGYVTKRGAEAWLRDVLDQARRGTLPGQVRTGITFAEAAAEWLRYIEHDRERKPWAVAGYKALVRSQLLPAFGEQPIESITTPMIERWLADVDRSSNRRTKALVLLHSIFIRPAGQFRGRRREATAAPERRHRGLLARGGQGAGPGGGVAAGRGDLPRRGVHRPAPRRAARAALARRGLRRPRDPRARKLRRGRADDAEVGQGPLGPDGARRRDGARLARPTGQGQATTTWCSSARPARSSTVALSAAATSRRRSAPACDRCGSTTSAACRSGWATPTSRRR
jgi:hypothetical protein